MELKDRIKALRGAETQAAFGLRFGVAQTTVGRWERGSTPDPDQLIELARFAGLSLDDFLSGDSDFSQPEPAIIAMSETQTPYLPSSKESPLSTGLVEVSGREFASIPRFDARLSAGPGCILEHDPEPLGYQLFEAQWLRALSSAAPSHLAILQVDGDSMEDTLRDRDWVMIDRTQVRLNRSGIYALGVGDTAWVKRIELDLENKLVQIISDNTRYGVQRLPEEELRVLGRVIYVVGRKV
jgi:phage repressor protein C with HTH and peptisase S24 domain/DNA-binding XRE family transcriptional regulator